MNHCIFSVAKGVTNNALKVSFPTSYITLQYDNYYTPVIEKYSGCLFSLTLIRPGGGD